MPLGGIVISMVGDKKKLCIIMQNYPYGYGEKSFIEPELKRLSEADKFDITIISTAQKGSELTSSVDKNIRVVHIPSTSIFKRPFLSMKYGIQYFFSKDVKTERLELKKEGITFGRLLYSVIFFIWASTFYHDLRKEKLDLDHTIIYTYWCHVQTLAIAMHKNDWKNIRLVSRIHGFDLYDERAPYGRCPFKKIVDDKLDKLFFIAETGLEYYLDSINTEFNEKYILSRMGTECRESYEEIRAQQRKIGMFVLVSCSNIIALKRVEIIIQALSLIDEIRIKWIHFGDGDERKETERKASELLDTKANIQYDFRGQSSNSEILSFYKECFVGCFITTSQSEGCPVSIQEAMSFGIPIIATGVGEIPRMVEGNGILLSENPSPEEVACAIKQVGDVSIEEMNRMREKSRFLWEQHFDADKNYKLFVERLVNC